MESDLDNSAGRILFSRRHGAVICLYVALDVDGMGNGRSTRECDRTRIFQNSPETMSAVLETAQFDTVESALRFAFRQDRENYQLSLLNRMASGPGTPGRGLGGLEGAAVAGSICRHAQALGFGPEAILKARYGQREIKCKCGSECCKGYRPCEAWDEAIAVISSYTAAAITVSKYPLRHGIVRRYFGVRVDMGKLAQKCDVAQRTAEDHTAKVKQFLKQKEGEAFHTISANLREAGIVYTHE